MAETLWSAPASTVASVDTGQLSPALGDLLGTFIPRGSHCLQVGETTGITLREWLAGHDCSHVDIPASRATGLPFQDGSFDAALLLGVIDQLGELRPAAGELRRVLKAGGVLLVTATNVSYWRHRLDRATRPNEPQPEGISPGSLRRLLLESGFNLVGVEGQDGAFIRDLPLAGRLSRRHSSGPYRVAERWFPWLLGSNVGAFAIRA